MAVSLVIANEAQIKESYLRYYQLRLNKGLTDLDVSKMVHVSNNLFYYWKKGEKMPSVKNLFKIAELFNTQVTYITDGITI